MKTEKVLKRLQVRNDIIKGEEENKIQPVDNKGEPRSNYQVKRIEARSYTKVVKSKTV